MPTGGGPDLIPPFQNWARMQRKKFKMLFCNYFKYNKKKKKKKTIKFVNFK